MLTVLFGSDTLARSKKLELLLADFVKRGVSIDRYNDVRFTPELVRSLAANTSLFGESAVVILHDIADSVEKRDELESVLDDMALSSNQFFVIENNLLVGFVKKAEAAGALVLKFDSKVPKKKPVEAFNTFAITDAYCERKRSLAWPLYRKAIDLGGEPRALASQIFWAIKSMLLAAEAKSPAESGLSPFVYQKAKAGALHFTKDELAAYLVEVTRLFHDSLLNGSNIEYTLESFILRSLEKKPR